MKLKANDTLHVSSVKADNIAPGEVFEVDENAGKHLVARGLAAEVKSAPKPTEPKPAKGDAGKPA